MEATISLERQRARVIAEEYRRRGYEVVEEPSQEQLPDFLTLFQRTRVPAREFPG